ncbi:MAG TPA: hypothetical protein VK580_00570 [Steroidobacteraceae bacterium]|jgi:hypothetical protein|nr:hypothetical protein [Steroidobacteraceae bacterium]
MVELGADAAGELNERRWFALLSAIRSVEGECGILLEASKLADLAWRRACVQLAEFEALRDALEEQISASPSFPMKQTTRLNAEARSGFRRAGKH